MTAPQPPPLWLTRARLRQDAGLAALGPVLLPAADDARASVSHRLVWTLFADAADRRRDFLYREEAPGKFLILSARPPNPAHPLFDVEPKRFSPALEPGDRLGFRLHANPTVALGAAEGRGGRADVVMAALHAVPKDERAAARAALTQREGETWLSRIGARDGFVVERVRADGYLRRRIERQGGGRIVLGVVDFEGVIRVDDSAAFLERLAAGFGRARAFGCGLMLIRRA